jgi:hypothetical protein
VNVVQGMIIVRFRNREESLLLAVAVQYIVRGLKGLTTVELDSSEIYLALQFWLKSIHSN